MKKLWMAGLIVCLLTLAAIPSSTKIAAAQPGKKAIVVVSFGTTFAEARESCLDSIEDTVKAAFPDYEVRRAFTSKIVIKRLWERDNIQVDDLEQALTRLKAEGFSEVIVQTTHLTPGEEFSNNIVTVVNKFKKEGAFSKLAIGRPVMYYTGNYGTADDITILLNAIKTQMPRMSSKEAVLFMGHGSPNQPSYVYAMLQDRMKATKTKAFVGLVENDNHPNFNDAVRMMEKAGIKKVILMPLMVVAGDHANNDMAGDGPNSWKNRLVAQGFTVETYMHGLGENAAYRDIYVKHIQDAIDLID